MYRYWVAGTCLAGNTCIFSHGPAHLVKGLQIDSSSTPPIQNANIQDYGPKEPSTPSTLADVVKMSPSPSPGPGALRPSSKLGRNGTSTSIRNGENSAPAQAISNYKHIPWLGDRREGQQGVSQGLPGSYQARRPAEHVSAEVSRHSTYVTMQNVRLIAAIRRTQGRRLLDHLDRRDSLFTHGVRRILAVSRPRRACFISPHPGATIAAVAVRATALFYPNLASSLVS